MDVCGMSDNLLCPPHGWASLLMKDALVAMWGFPSKCFEWFQWLVLMLYMKSIFYWYLNTMYYSYLAITPVILCSPMSNVNARHCFRFKVLVYCTVCHALMNVTGVWHHVFISQYMCLLSSRLKHISPLVRQPNPAQSSHHQAQSVSL